MEEKRLVAWPEKPLKNAELWQRLDRAAAPHEMTWSWVKGHAGNPMNERCDELAVAETEKPGLQPDPGFVDEE